MASTFLPELHTGTPTVSIHDNRGRAVRTLVWHRTAVGGTTETRITRHQYNIRGQLVQSIDPRLYAARQSNTNVKPNFTWHYDLAGQPLRTESVDAGCTVSLSDCEGRPLLAVTATGAIKRWQYEDHLRPGRPLAVSELTPGQSTPCTTDRFIWAGNTQAEKNHNLAGQCVRHYDSAGLNQLNSLSLSATALSLSRRLLLDDQEADWAGNSEENWQAMLAENVYSTQSTTDATGTLLTQTDAMRNLQRVAYDVAGQLMGSWLTLTGKGEQEIVKSLTYSAAGQKLREQHGNGVVTEYTYEPQTQRLIGITTTRCPSDHPAGAKVLQDLRYEYDPVGNVINLRNEAETTRFWRNQKVVPENTYTYDTLYQLTCATGREMANIGQQGSALPSLIAPLPADNSVYTQYTRTYTYDWGGNLNQIRHCAPATGNNYTTDITVSDRSNRAVLSQAGLTPEGVDALFDVGGHQLSLRPGLPVDWNARGELQHIALVSREEGTSDRERYRYGGDGMRLLKVSERQTSNTVRIQQVAYLPRLELRTTRNGTTTIEDLHVLTIGEAGCAQVRVLHWESTPPSGISNNQVRYSYDNLIGSSTLELDDRGEIISQEEYYPYGGTAVWAARNQIEASYKTARYSGKERDATGLYYYGYRYYQPWVGRWLSTDSMGTVDGLNLYRMVLNNPVSNFDYAGTRSLTGGIINAAANVFSNGFSLPDLSSFSLPSFSLPSFSLSDFSLPSFSFSDFSLDFSPVGIARSVGSFVVNQGWKRFTRYLFKNSTHEQRVKQIRWLKAISMGVGAAMLLGGIAATAGAAIPVIAGVAVAGLISAGGIGFFSNKISNAFAKLMTKLPGSVTTRSNITTVVANEVHGGSVESAVNSVAINTVSQQVYEGLGMSNEARMGAANAIGAASGTDNTINNGRPGRVTGLTAPAAAAIVGTLLESPEHSAEMGVNVAVGANDGARKGRWIDRQFGLSMGTSLLAPLGIEIPGIEAINAELVLSTTYGVGRGINYLAENHHYRNLREVVPNID
ncbi:RHS repeat domain-containing protein [Mycoavidus sp. SF9855]|uniref:RHS repeat domain-containing protein n=1 Tax=Mycoavidus sp. SF9855 TaxID=2968475 RepID=UPI00211BFA34|nr:RHS repeat domain-containing protein [Mycoavidus sp. SF9855]UUM22270.1 RHS repeat protein [Mycoavidus sp. SF9855]